MSDKNIAIIGVRKAKYFLLKYSPPKIEIAPIAVKFGGWGIILENAPISIISNIMSVLFFINQI